MPVTSPTAPTDVVQGALNPWHRTPARQTGIDEDDAIVDHNQVDIHKTDPQLEDTVNDLTHELMMPERRSRRRSATSRFDFYLVGCDGMRGVRERMSIGFVGDRYAESFPLADVRMDSALRTTRPHADRLRSASSL